MLRRLTNVAWWLGISVYFGGLLTLGVVVAPAVFETTKSSAMTMPGIVSPPLVMDQQVGGEIFGAALNRFATVEVIALFVMLVGIAGFLRAHWPIRWSAWVILIIWLGLGALLQYDLATLRPKIWELRTTVRQEAAAHAVEGLAAATQDPEDFATAHRAVAPIAPWPNRDEFQRLHEESETIAHIKIYLLLAMILVSAWRGIADGPAKNKVLRHEKMREGI